MHILSFGGGVNSTALLLLLIQTGSPLDEVVFADTGAELPETYDHLQVVERYVSEHGIPLRLLAHRIGGRDLYQTCWQRRVIPSTIWRWSTRDFKVLPIHRYYRTLKTHVYQYLAIAYDEFQRMKTSNVSYVTNIYPLVEQKVTREECSRIIRDAGLPEPVKSSCFFCPFSSLDRWEWLRATHPDLFDKAVALEEHSKHFPAQRLTDQVFRHRAAVPLRGLPALLTDRGAAPDVDEDGPCGAECMT